MSSFWHRLPKPFFVQAPMEDVTDAAFRMMIARHGRPHVMFTEFTSADGLVLAPESGQKVLRRKLSFHEVERPIVAQLFSARPERMERAAVIAAELGFDGIDINMGCPAKEVVSAGCGAGMIKNPPLAQEMVRAAQRGAPGIPISVKTRIGYSRDETETWVPTLLETGLAAGEVARRVARASGVTPGEPEVAAAAGSAGPVEVECRTSR